jgi:hypothetical protein
VLADFLHLELEGIALLFAFGVERLALLAGSIHDCVDLGVLRLQRSFECGDLLRVGLLRHLGFGLLGLHNTSDGFPRRGRGCSLSNVLLIWACRGRSVDVEFLDHR